MSPPIGSQRCRCCKGARLCARSAARGARRRRRGIGLCPTLPRAHQTAAYTQYVCPLKVESEPGCCRSHSLMLSSQLPLRNTLRRTVFQLSE